MREGRGQWKVGGTSGRREGPVGGGRGQWEGGSTPISTLSHKAML